MKRLTKVCLIIAVTAAVLGLVGIGAGIAMGASADEFLNISIEGTHRVFKPANEISASSDSVALGNADTRGLKLDMKAGELDFYLYDGKEILVSCENGKNVFDYFAVEEDEEGISIEENNHHGNVDLKLVVYLPDRKFQDIDLDVGAASVYAETLYADEISVDLGAGNMVVECLDGRDMDLDCGVGNLEIKLRGQESDYTYTLECGAGTICLGEDCYSGLSKDTRIDNSGRKDVEKHIDVDCGIGELRIKFEEEL